MKNPRLVRGLDYYCHTVFEWTTNLLGAQGAVLAGGRYDGLIQSMGGQSTPGVGWASGIERLSLLLSPLEPTTPIEKKVAVIFAEEAAEEKALQITYRLRQMGLQVELPLSGNMGKKFKRADKLGCGWAVVLGSSEIAEEKVTLKNLLLGKQEIMAEEIFWQELLKNGGVSPVF